MNNNLSQKFNIISLLKFTTPTIIMMVFMSLYQMIDGIFVSNFVGADALSALNIVFPVISVVIAISIMLATGGSAIIAKNMGEGKYQEAKENFSLIICVGAVVGILFTIIGLTFINPIIKALGATPSIYEYCYDYLGVFISFSILAIFQMLFQTFFVTTGKPGIGLLMTGIGGCANIFFDYLFIVVMNKGVTGAAIATLMGYSIPALFGLAYFTFNRKNTLHFVKPKLRIEILLEACSNGASEMVTNLAASIITFLFNIIMLKYLGENGVAAITIVLYAQFLLTSLFMGFSSGVAPIFSYNYGEGNITELKKIFKISIGFVTISSILVFGISILFSTPIIAVFARPGSEVFEITKHGFILFAISYLFTGVNIFASSMFTAFSNGKVSATISFLRTFVFIILSILLLPLVIGANGIWLAVPMAEALTIIMAIVYIIKLKTHYHYL